VFTMCTAGHDIACIRVCWDTATARRH